MQLPKDLENDLLKFHENAQHPIRYVLINEEGEYSDHVEQIWGIFSSLQDAVFNYLSLWDTNYKENKKKNEYINNEWIYLKEIDLQYRRYTMKGFYISEISEGTSKLWNDDMFIYNIRNNKVYKFKKIAWNNSVPKDLQDCTEIKEFDNYEPLKNFDSKKLKPTRYDFNGSIIDDE